MPEQLVRWCTVRAVSTEVQCPSSWYSGAVSEQLVQRCNARAVGTEAEVCNAQAVLVQRPGIHTYAARLSICSTIGMPCTLLEWPPPQNTVTHVSLISSYCSLTLSSSNSEKGWCDLWIWVATMDSMLNTLLLYRSN